MNDIKLLGRLAQSPEVKKVKQDINMPGSQWLCRVKMIKMKLTSYDVWHLVN